MEVRKIILKEKELAESKLLQCAKEVFARFEKETGMFPTYIDFNMEVYEEMGNPNPRREITRCTLKVEI